MRPISTTLFALALSSSTLVAASAAQARQSVFAVPAASTAPDREAALAAYDAKDYSTAWAGLSQLAGRGDAYVDFSAASLLANGLGVEADPAAAAALYHAAGSQGHPTALYNLSLQYESGTGVPFDPRKATDLSILAAFAGDYDQAMDIGYAYATGIGRAQNRIEAFAWTQLAFDLGQDAGNNLEVIQSDLQPLERVRAKRRHSELEAELLGEREPRTLPAMPSISELPLPATLSVEGALQARTMGDQRLALRMCEALGAQGDAVAAFYAADLLGDHDPQAARTWMQRSAEGGDRDGAFELGVMMLEGFGGAQDVSGAVRWLEAAQRQGREGVEQALGHARELLKSTDAPTEGSR